MCGIIGYTGVAPALGRLMRGLETLTYRGYDSAGVAVNENGRICICRAAGAIEQLARRQALAAMATGCAGIGHTRWATHGAPTEGNAHPHTDMTNEVAVVHNGIIENSAFLRRELEATGTVFSSETDTEVIPHLLMHYRRRGAAPREAIRATIERLRGSYALAVMFADAPEELYAVRHQSPLAVAKGEDGCYLASDVTALLPHTRRVCYLEEGVIVRLDRRDVSLFDAQGERMPPIYTRVTWGAQDAGRGDYAHYMEKELYEVPEAIARTSAAAEVSPLFQAGKGGLLSDIDGICFVGCGSAYHVGLASVLAGERITGLPTRAEIASEFRYHPPLLTPRTLVVAISQSGETADTLAAVRAAKSRGYRTLAIVNVEGSAIAAAADAVFYTQAGPEIAVATTKAYCAQMVTAEALLYAVARARKGVAEDREEMDKTTACCREILASRGEIKKFAKRISKSRDAFFIGRGMDAAICREGALKLKEITYLHAEAYEAGELKHGTISLIEEGTPVVAIVTDAALADKMETAVREVEARGAWVLVLASADICLPPHAEKIQLPQSARAPLLAAYATQWLAYEVSLERGLNPDRPRNLAKSVTVE